SPEAAVVARPTVVAHHEVMVGRDGDGLRQIAGSAGRAGVDEALLGDLSVDDRMAVLHAERVTRPGDDPLDEVDVRLAGGRGVAGGPARAAGPGPRVSALAAGASLRPLR